MPGLGWSAEAPAHFAHGFLSAPGQNAARSNGHHRDWLEACKGGKPASSNFEYGAKLTEFVLLGNVALRTGKKLYGTPPT